MENSFHTESVIIHTCMRERKHAHTYTKTFAKKGLLTTGIPVEVIKSCDSSEIHGGSILTAEIKPDSVCVREKKREKESHMNCCLVT